MVRPNFFPRVQFSRSPEALNQIFRSMTPSTGPFIAEVSARPVAALFGVTVVHLSELGIGGNTQYPSLDMNNVEVANLLSTFLAENHLDGG